MPKKITIEFVREEFTKRGYELLDDIYENSQEYLHYICPFHSDKILKIKWNNFNHGQGCKFCADDAKKLNYDFVKLEFEKRGYELLEDVYIDSLTPMKFKCPHHPHEDLYISWQVFKQGCGCKCCGRESKSKKLKLDVDFVREEFERRGYTFISLEYIGAQAYIKCKCLKHPDKNLSILWTNFNQGHGCKFCWIDKSKETKTKTHEEFINDLKIKNKHYDDINILGTYVGGKSRISCKCKVDGYEWNPFADKLLQGDGCPVCSNHTIMIGINDMYTTNPEQASWLLNPDDGYKYMQKSSKKTNWKCPNCGNIIKNKAPNVINKHGLICSMCSDGLSIPNKFMFNVLIDLNVNFKREEKFDWCKFKLHNKDYRGVYDFVIYNKNIIIEADGGYHDKPHSRSKLTIEDTKFIDSEKDRLAKENGYEIIRIDCRESELEYMKDRILNSRLNNIFNFDSINWILCYKNCLKSTVIEACELWNNGIKSTVKIGSILKLTSTTILKYLKRGKLANLCDYNVEKGRIEIGKVLSKNHPKKRMVVCVTTNEIFKSITQASKIYNIKSSSNIGSCCKNKRNFTGKHPETGEPLRWAYFDPEIHKDYTLIS